MHQREPLRVSPPTVESDEDLDVGLMQLMLVDSRERSDRAELDRQVAAITAEIQAGQVVQVGRTKLTFAEYREKLEEAIRLYAEPRRRELLGDGKAKSRKFSHGEIGWRKGVAKLVDIDGRPATTTAKLLTCSRAFGKAGLVNKIRAILAGITINAAVAAADLFAIEFKLNRKNALQLAQDGKLSADWLEKHNLKLDEGDEDLWIKPSEQLVQSELRTAA